MGSVFEEAAIEASAAIDETYGKTLRIIPALEGRYTANAVDPNRPAFDIVGSFFLAPDAIKMQSTKVGRDFFQQFIGAKCFISIDIGLLAGREIRKGDRVQCYDEAGALVDPPYEVTVGGEREVSRMIYPLVEASDPV